METDDDERSVSEGSDDAMDAMRAAEASVLPFM